MHGLFIHSPAHTLPLVNTPTHTRERALDDKHRCRHRCREHFHKQTQAVSHLTKTQTAIKKMAALLRDILANMRTTTHPGLDNKDKNNAVNHTFRHTSATNLSQLWQLRKSPITKKRKRFKTCKAEWVRLWSYHEERHGAAPVDGAVLYVGLVGQVVGRLDGNLHPLDGQEGCQVGRVGGDYDQGERPPTRRRRFMQQQAIQKKPR